MGETGFSFNLLGCLVAVLFVLFFAGILGWMFWHEKRKTASAYQTLAGLGFHEVPQPGLEVFQRLERLHRNRENQRFELRALYEKPALRGKFWAFDLVETSGDENTWLGENALAVYSPDLHLPRIYIMGRIAHAAKSSAWMASAAEKVIRWAAGHSQLTQLDLTAYPEIDQRLLVLAEDVETAQAFLLPDRLRQLTWLAETDRFSEITGQGDMLVLKRQVRRGRSLRTQPAEAAALLKDAQIAWQALRAV